MNMKTPDSYQESNAVLPVLSTDLVLAAHMQYRTNPEAFTADSHELIEEHNPSLAEAVADLPRAYAVPESLHEAAVSQAVAVYALLHRQGYSDKAVARFNRRNDGNLTTEHLPNAFMQRNISLGMRAMRAFGQRKAARPSQQQDVLSMVVSPHIPRDFGRIDVRHAHEIIAQHDTNLSLIVNGDFHDFFAAPTRTLGSEQRFRIGQVSLAMYELLDTAERSSTFKDSK